MSHFTFKLALLIVLFFQVFNSFDDVQIKNRPSYANKTEKTLPELCSTLLNTYWHQYEPFNKYISVLLEEKQAVAGCTIISI